MTSFMRVPSPVSRITLALLEDSGSVFNNIHIVQSSYYLHTCRWYRANYAAADAFAYGNQAGCDYLLDSCATHISRQKLKYNYA